MNVPIGIWERLLSRQLEIEEVTARRALELVSDEASRVGTGHAD